ncbi:MAG: hypothetical protein WCE81_08930 [Halobacteriota archaeon]
MNSRKRDEEEIRHRLDMRQTWRQFNKEIDGVMYDTQDPETQPIGERRYGGWSEDRYESFERLYRTRDGEYFIHKTVTDRKTNKTSDDIVPISMSEAHDLIDRGYDKYMTEDQKAQIKPENECNEHFKREKNC